MLCRWQRSIRQSYRVKNPLQESERKLPLWIIQIWCGNLPHKYATFFNWAHFHSTLYYKIQECIAYYTYIVKSRKQNAAVNHCIYKQVFMHWGWSLKAPIELGKSTGATLVGGTYTSTPPPSPSQGAHQLKPPPCTDSRVIPIKTMWLHHCELLLASRNDQMQMGRGTIW